VKILVCRGPECGDKRNSAAVHAEILLQLKARPLDGVEVIVDWQSCFGKCQRGVNVMVREMRAGEDAFFRSFLGNVPGSALYNGVRPSEVERILREHVGEGRVVVEFKNRGV
jgi:(2Fe-2S) ferredoxin